MRLRIDAAGKADPDALEGLIGLLRLHRLHGFNHFADSTFGIRRKRNNFTRKKASVEIDDSDNSLMGPEVSGDNHQSIVKR